MAGLQNRNESWRVIFRYQGKQHSFWIGEVKEKEADTIANRIDYWLMRLKQNLVQLPLGCDIVTFLEHDGKPPEHVAIPAKDLTLDGLRLAYLRSQEKKLEETTLDGIRLHFKHLLRILGPKWMIPTLTRADLQAYVDKRAEEWIDPNIYRQRRREKIASLKPRKNRKPAPSLDEDKPLRHPSAATIRKEIISLRTAWNWARRFRGLTPEFPGAGLGYAKIEESLPFMNWQEAEARIAAGDDPDRIWGCVYLQPHEIAEFLSFVETKPVSPCVYPMICFAAHTGARRSEIVRVLPSDVDMTGGTVTIREKKRDKRKHTTRRVPLTSLMKEVLSKWIIRREKGKTLFCKETGQEITSGDFSNYFRRALRSSKWRFLKGLHLFRHSFISALASKGVDQRIIDEFVGHQTDEQRRRYRHLFPNVKQEALVRVFG